MNPGILKMLIVALPPHESLYRNTTVSKNLRVKGGGRLAYRKQRGHPLAFRKQTGQLGSRLQLRLSDLVELLSRW